MIFITFTIALSVLILSANYFTKSAEIIGHYIRLPSFVIGVFIVGIGTSLPELISGIISVSEGASEIVSGNIIGSNISNIFLITGMAVVINKKNISLRSDYLYIDLNFLIGSFLFFYIIAYDGYINLVESLIGIIIFIIYSIYLIKGGNASHDDSSALYKHFPLKALIILLIAMAGIYFGAEYTVGSIAQIAAALSIPKSIIALTLLSLGTTLPEIAVNISAIRQGKAEMAVGNILGSSVFNTLVIPPVTSAIGTVQVPQNLLRFSLPVMAACGLLFYLLTQDKKISVWEGLLFICMYVLFIIKTVAG